MKVFALLLLVLSSIVVAQNDFSIYPLTKPLGFGTQLETFPLQDGPTLPFNSAPMLRASPSFSMQYVYPGDDVVYSMQFVEPDPAMKYSIYTPETPEPTVEVIPNP